MARPSHVDESVRIEIRVSKQTAGYLDDLIKVGIHGQNRSEVAKTLVGREIERLIAAEILKLHQLHGTN
jgi:hypothetical protein